ncbi:transcriptional regulator YeiL [Brevibacillus sp. SYSU BS000544]|uniref:transcriptional regulator YeiL n=1 Tax=Brevibacillus sp. SYSU BS000544 TaxID=3416443 RepID=UPI003CE49B25
MIEVKDARKISHYVTKLRIDEFLHANLLEHIKLFLYKKCEHICRSDENLEYLFFLIEGKAKVYLTLKNGKSLLIQFYKPLKVIGDIEFLYMNHANSNIQVIEDTYCLAIPMDIIRKQMIDDPAFLRFMCLSLGDKLFRLSKISSINLLYPLENRLASYILAHDDPSHESFTDSLTEVSELLGTSYRHLLRTFVNLEKQGAIRKTRKSVEILDRGMLEKLAEELYE